MFHTSWYFRVFRKNAVEANTPFLSISVLPTHCTREFHYKGRSAAEVREIASCEQKFRSRAGAGRLPVLRVYERDRFHANTQIFPIQICGSVFWHLSKQSLRSCLSSPVLYTHICTHTPTPALKSAGIVSEPETQPASDLNFPALQEAGILTPVGLS